MNNQLDLLDRLAVASFLLGLANYEENVDQTTLQQSLQKVVDELHGHMARQDAKLDKIEALLRRLLNE